VGQTKFFDFFTVPINHSIVFFARYKKAWFNKKDTQIGKMMVRSTSQPTLKKNI